MAIGTPVEVGSGVWTTGSTIAVTTTASVPAGSILFLFSNNEASGGSNTPVSSVSDGTGNTWAGLTTRGQGTGPENTDLWYGIMATGLSNGATVTATYSGTLSQGVVSLAYVTGLVTVSPLDKQNGATGSSTAPSSGSSGTLSQASEICVGVVGRYNAATTVTLTSIGSFTALTRKDSGSGAARSTVWPAYQIVSATTAQTYSGTLSVSGAWEATIGTFKGATVTTPPPQANRRVSRVPVTRRAKAARPVSPPGFISGTHLHPGASAFNFTLPPGAQANGWLLIQAANSSATSFTLTVTNAIQVVSAPANNMYLVAVAVKLTGADITNGFIQVTSSNSAVDYWGEAYDTSVTGFDPANVFPLTAAAYGTRGGVSQTTVTAPSAQPWDSNDYVVLISAERTTATGTTVTSISQGLSDYFYEDTVTTNVSVLAAHFTGPPVGLPTGSSTITYSGASGNAIAFLLPMTTTNSTQSLGQFLFGSHRSSPRWLPLRGLAQQRRAQLVRGGPQQYTQNLSAATSFTSSDTLMTSHGQAASIGFTGTRAALTVRGAFTAALSFTGNLATAAVHHFTQLFTALLRFQDDTVKAVIPLYIYPASSAATTGWADVIANRPFAIVANPATGPGTSLDTNYQAAINAVCAAGVKVFGYVNTANGTRAIGTDSDTAASNTVKGDVNGWTTLYQVDGYFFDLVPTDSGANVTYMQTASDYGRAHLPAAYIAFNPGTYPLVRDYLDIADVTITFEGDYTASNYAAYTVPGYASAYDPLIPPSRKGHLVYGVPDDATMRVASTVAASLPVDYFYASSSDGLWGSFPPYWPDQYGIRILTPLQRRVTQVRTDAVGFTSTLTVTSRRVIAATVSFASSQIRRVTHNLAGSLSFTSTVTRRVTTARTATVAFTTSFATQAVHFFTQTFNAAVSFTGATTKTVGRSVAAAVGFTGTTTRRAARQVTATLGLTSSQSRRASTTNTAQLGFSGTTRVAVSRVLTAAVSFTGSFVASTGQHFTQLFTATIGFLGNLLSRKPRDIDIVNVTVEPDRVAGVAAEPDNIINVAVEPGPTGEVE